jgi:hypothetical protein
MTSRRVQYPIGRIIHATYDVMYHGGIQPITINDEIVYTIRNTSVLMKKVHDDIAMQRLTFKVIDNPERI